MQDYPGSGSPTSPILISDDDEQMVTVSGKLTKGEFSVHSPRFNATFSKYSGHGSGHGRVSRTGPQVGEKRDFTGRNRQVEEEGRCSSFFSFVLSVHAHLLFSVENTQA